MVLRLQPLALKVVEFLLQFGNLFSSLWEMSLRSEKLMV